jgi:hypothetical protein
VKRIVIFGGGTISHIANHLALSAPAYGSTARRLAELFADGGKMEVVTYLSRMADPVNYRFETFDDLARCVDEVVADARTKIVIFNAAVADFRSLVENRGIRYKSANFSEDNPLALNLVPQEKLIHRIRRHRKDIFLVSFKTTVGASPQEQYLAALNNLKASSSNLVPEEAVYYETKDRDVILNKLISMTLLRSHLTFTQSTVIAGDPVAWDSPEVPSSLRAVVDYCIERGAYKKFRGVTAGHFAFKVDDQTFITSKRKTDFNEMRSVGLVKVKTDGPDTVVAFGAKPSVGGQSQRIVFKDHPANDCIVHFHCEIKPGSRVPVRSQEEVECGSHQCGKNTSEGLKNFGNLKAVFLDKHGPNIVFNRNIDPQEVIKFIEDNFDLTTKTGGYQV